MTYRFSQRSVARLQTCHPDLQLLMVEALADPDCPSDMSVLCGYRGEEEQNAAYDSGRSKLRYPRSKHNQTPLSLAVDVAPYVAGAVSWDWKHYHPLAAHIKATWQRLEQRELTTGNYSLSWGGDWTSLKDGPHWQLDKVGT